MRVATGQRLAGQPVNKDVVLSALLNAGSLVIGFPDYRKAAQRLARAAGMPYADALIHHFPDGETRLRLPELLPEYIVLCRALDHPNSKLLELVLAAATARELGARHITLVAPYLCYMRQDKAFHPGEAVSQRIVGTLLSQWIDALITVDSHLHRVHQLQDAVPVNPAINLSATAVMSAFIGKQLDTPFLVGPDEESEQWVAAIARDRDLDYCIAHKQRFGDKQVRVSLPKADYRNRHIVLVDDVASTGHTLEAATLALAAFDPASISVLVTHALFAGDAQARLRRAGVSHIWSTDAIPHASNALHLDHLLAGALDKCRNPRTVQGTT
ncbi:MAG TPA: phosphoribosylpyrophosphate synthetase [Gammaproteobacteria bacterium]|nr:phosphoribosylpyrophosphate synthetase [Gammaproteobacteria bacterium]